jgi:hypothetical protein
MRLQPVDFALTPEQELVRSAAREFCERDLLPELKGRRQFHTRVLMNVLAILEREWEGEEQALRDEWRRLDALLGDAFERTGEHVLRARS